MAGSFFQINGVVVKFFDEKMMRSMDRATARSLSRAGAFIRRRAKSSIRKRKSVSKPGSPPSSHSGKLKRFIFFGLEQTKRTVVVGPNRLMGPGFGEAPNTLEFGGTTILRRDKTILVGGPGRGAGRVSPKNKKRVKKGTVIRHPARPYMGPALKKEVEAGTIPKQFAGSIGT